MLPSLVYWGEVWNRQKGLKCSRVIGVGWNWTGFPETRKGSGGRKRGDGRDVYSDASKSFKNGNEPGAMTHFITKSLYAVIDVKEK